MVRDKRGSGVMMGATWLLHGHIIVPRKVNRFPILLFYLFTLLPLQRGVQIYGSLFPVVYNINYSTVKGSINKEHCSDCILVSIFIHKIILRFFLSPRLDKFINLVRNFKPFLNNIMFPFSYDPDLIYSCSVENNSDSKYRTSQR